MPPQQCRQFLCPCVFGVGPCACGLAFGVAFGLGLEGTAIRSPDAKLRSRQIEPHPQTRADESIDPPPASQPATPPQPRLQGVAGRVVLVELLHAVPLVKSPLASQFGRSVTR